MRLVRPWLLVAALLAVVPLTANTATAELGTTDGSLYLLVSIDEEFDINVDGGTGSTTVLVNLGVLTGGGGVFDTRFVAQAIQPINLPPEVTLEDLDGNAATLVGSFMTASEDVHMVTPVPGAIDGDIQVGLFAATHDGSLDALNGVFDVDTGERIFPTTYSIAWTIAAHMPGRDGEPSQQDVSDVADAVFDSDQELSLIEGLVTSEGELFPHTESQTPLFHASVSLQEGEEEGEFVVSSDVCKIVDVDVMPHSDKNRVNIKKNGLMSVAFLTTDDFDASEIDGETVRIGSVAPKRYSLKDVDQDGDDDLLCKFRVKKLVDDGVLGIDTTDLTIRADLTDGTCVEGTDFVAPKKKGDDDCEDDD
jgi:hypothetical protein